MSRRGPVPCRRLPWPARQFALGFVLPDPLALPAESPRAQRRGAAPEISEKTTLTEWLNQQSALAPENKVVYRMSLSKNSSLIVLAKIFGSESDRKGTCLSVPI